MFPRRCRLNSDPLSPRVRGLATVLLAVGASMGASAAQVRTAVAPVVNAPVSQPFAWPWEVSLEHVRAAMAGANYEIEQIRRVLDRSDPRRIASWIRIRERLLHVAETARSPEQFQLEMLGIENQSLTPFELQLRAARFAQRSDFIFHYQSFRVADSELAAKNYALTLFGIATRIGQPVYQVAVTSKVGARSAWYLELSLDTGYPLYRAEYDVHGRLVGEVEVTKYQAGLVQSGGADAIVPGRVVGSGGEVFATPTEAVAALGLSTKGVPAEGVMPPGYEPFSSRVVTNPLNGRKKAVLIYSDGIDQVIVQVGEEQDNVLRGEGHIVGVHQDAVGVTQCLFAHARVQYVVIGRGADEPVREVAHRLYSQVVR